MATGETKLSYLDVVDDIQDGDTVPILRNGKNYMSTGLAGLNADLTDMWVYDATSTSGYSIDLNDLNSGFDLIRNCTNAPDDTNWWFVLTLNGNANTAFQLATRYNANTGLFKRYKSGGNWSSWVDATGISTTSLGGLNLPPIVEDDA